MKILESEKLILEEFWGSMIKGIVMDTKYKEYIEVHTDKGSFLITSYNPNDGETRDYIEYTVSPGGV